jgi:predicted Fe-Mo cluster-binding NifX family protein
MTIEELGDAELIAEHFGVCTKFLVCELDAARTLIATETYFNPLAGQFTGACQLPGYVKQFNVTAIIAGGMGRNAVMKFHEFGIEVINAPGLSFDEALSLFKDANVDTTSDAGHTGPQREERQG